MIVRFDRVTEESSMTPGDDAVTLDLSIRRDATVDALLSLQSEPIDFSKKTATTTTTSSNSDTDQPPDTDRQAAVFSFSSH